MLELWRDGRATIRFRADHVQIDVGDRSHREPCGDVAWPYCAFVSGLDSVGIGQADQPAVTALVHALAKLEPSVSAVEAFRGWLWEQDDDALELRTFSGFTTAHDGSGLSALGRGLTLAAIRSGALEALDGVAVPASALDRAAVHEAFAVDLSVFQRKSAARELEVTAELVESLRDESADGRRWATRRAALLLARADEGDEVVDALLADLLVELVAVGGDPAGFAVALKGRETLHRLVLRSGERLAAAIVRGAAAGLDLGRTGIALGPAVRMAVLGTLTTNESEFAQGLLAEVGPEQLGADLRGPGVHDQARAMGLRVLSQSDATAAATILNELPLAARYRMLGGLGRLPGVEYARTRVPVEVARGFFEGAGPEAPPQLVSRSFSCGVDAGLEPELAEKVVSSLVATREFDSLAAISRDRRCDPRLREGAFDALAAQPSTRASAAKWRLAELLDSPNMQSRFRAARKAV